MTDKVYVVTDLGVGDGGKGGVVHKVAAMQRAHTVIKRGGAQGSHGVRTSGGETFAFSQWGCATLGGTPTHLTAQMVVSPEGLLNEADALRYGHGIYSPFDLLTVDEEALCATPYDGIASRTKELVLGENPRKCRQTSNISSSMSSGCKTGRHSLRRWVYCTTTIS